MLRGLVTAFRTLTVLPVPGRDAERFSDALYWFPLVGLVLGLLEVALATPVIGGRWPELAALLVVAGGVVLTRGLHADGLADLADGFFGGRDPQSRLRIMKDSCVGSFGVLALVLLLLCKWVAALRLLHSGAVGQIVAGVVLSRMAQVLLAASMPYARPEGGTADSFVSGAGRLHLGLSLVTAATILVVLLRFDVPGIAALMAAALVSAVLMGLLAARRIGGVTGDVLGAASEVTETVVWVVGALLQLPC